MKLTPKLAVAMLAALAFATALFLFAPKAMAAEKGSVELFLGRSTLIEGESVAIRAYSSCGDVLIYLDGEKIAQGHPSAEAVVAPEAGTHVVEALAGACGASLQLAVERRECAEGNRTRCTVEGCSGVASCIGGKYSDCALPRKECLPGEKIGCNVDGCSFGYSACDSCGRFGPCLPWEDAPCETCGQN